VVFDGVMIVWFWCVLLLIYCPSWLFIDVVEIALEQVEKESVIAVTGTAAAAAAIVLLIKCCEGGEEVDVLWLAARRVLSLSLATV